MDYSISEVARRFGIAVSALRYYDQVGVLRPAGRRGTVRTYGRDELRRLALIRLLHRDGMMSLADTAATLTEHPAQDRSATRQVIEGSLAAMQEQIRRLRDAQQVLDHLLTCPQDNPVRDCRYLQAQLEQTVETALTGEPPDAGSTLTP
ncbi:MerR family transcriptional regulator [Amycolatopsis jiangsuensis]|uniref:DNA-binding transcriptional MerR regulator n=1 Tax=Amycolatopsis jiangsuensis TaxID=1181879 RepID=A0A840J3P9_9PSEU|nr:MerR family transcriptional regulator [Amycolatopsis jiangsuensis]MBB4688349.1 DNA-binding transcriptional MerR regulator [Amycolatopsis jiangsuensis]